MEGFYIAYLTGKAGSNVAVFLIKSGAIVGVDGSGMSYDGNIEVKHGNDGYVCKVVFVIPAGVPLITGASPLQEPQRVPLAFELPRNFGEGQVVMIVTPLGPVNVKFQKVRDI